jgi:hypothetical protein
MEGRRDGDPAVHPGARLRPDETRLRQMRRDSAEAEPAKIYG